MTITVDTNIFVELLLGQERAQECKSLLDEIEQGRIDAVLSHFSLHAIEATIRSPRKLSEFLKNIEISRGLEIFDTSLSDEQSIAVLSSEIGLDFDDSVQFYIARRTGSSAIVSFDRHFDGQGIPRREPIQILEQLHAELSKEKRRRNQAK
jgi:uncharacterized protein